MDWNSWLHRIHVRTKTCLVPTRRGMTATTLNLKGPLPKAKWANLTHAATFGLGLDPDASVGESPPPP